MPEPLTSYITAWKNTYSYIKSDLLTAYNYIYNAGENIRVENFAQAAVNLQAGAEGLRQTAFHFQGTTPQLPVTMTAAMRWIDDNWYRAVEIDMDMMLDAMWNSTQLQPLLFIAYVDAMRSSIYDKWVSEQTLSDYVKHFKFDVVGT